MYAGVHGQWGMGEGEIMVMVETFGAWLKAQAVSRFGTLRAFATAIGKEPTYISRWVNNHERPSYESARQIADLLGIPIVEILSRAGMPIHAEDAAMRPTPDLPTPSLFSIVDQLDEVRVIRLDQLVSAGPGDAIPQGVEYRARIPGRKRRSPLYAVIATGTCMEPEIRPGDEVLFDAERPAEPGHTVVAVIDNEDAVVKRLVEDRGVRYLLSEDGNHRIPVDARVRIVGVVVLSQRRFL